MGVRYRFVVAVGAFAVSLVLAGSAWAGQTIVPLNLIKDPSSPGGPPSVSLTRTPSFLIESTDAPGPDQQVVCSFNQTVPTDGAGSCGTATTTNCPTVACWIYTPTAPHDGSFNVWTYVIQGQTPQPEVSLGVTISTALPDTGPVKAAALEVVRGSTLAIGGRSRNTAEPTGAANFTYAFGAAPAVQDDSSPRPGQCALAPVGRPPTKWVACNAGTDATGAVDSGDFALPVPVDTRQYRLWIRAVDVFGRIDPTPSLSAPISPVPCTQRIVGRAPHSLGAILHHTLAVRVLCMEATRVAVAYALTDAEARQTGAEQEVWWNAGRVTRAGGSTIVRLRPTRFDPSVVRLHHLKLDLWSGEYADTSDSGAAAFRAAIFATHVLR